MRSGVEPLERRVFLSALPPATPHPKVVITAARAADLEVLPAPVLTGAPCDAGQAMLRWSDASGLGTGYELDRYNDDAGAFIAIADLPSGADAYNDLGLDPSKTYKYQIKALGDGINTSDSVFSNVVSVVPSGQQTPSSQTILGGAGDDAIVMRKQASGTLVDVWVNAPETGPATQTADAAQPIVIQGMGGTDAINFDDGNGSPLGIELDLNEPAGGSVTITTASLAIPAGSILKLSTGISRSSDHPALRMGGLSIESTGSIDIGDNTVIVGSTIGTLEGYLAAGRMKSSAAGLTIGYADRGDGSLLLKPTFFGDANLDGKVDFSDLLKLAQNYGTSAASWDRGDFTYDGKVDFSDLLKLAQNYGSVPPTGAPANGITQSWIRPHRSRSMR